MILVFHGGEYQLLISVDNNRYVEFMYDPITGHNFISVEKAFKKLDRNKSAAQIMRYNLNKKNMSNGEFRKYLIDEFTHDKWAGFKYIGEK